MNLHLVQRIRDSLRPHVIGLILLAVMRASAADVAVAELPEPPPRPPTEVYRWEVSYTDALLGTVDGYAAIDWKNRRGLVVLDHPTEGRQMRLEVVQLTAPDPEKQSPALITLRGRSPDWRTVNPPDTRFAPKLPASPGDEPKAKAFDLEQKIEAKLAAAPDGDIVRLTLQATASGDLAGEWSYVADPVTERPASGVGRAGNFHLLAPGETVEGRSGFLGVQSGRERWEPQLPEIHDVVVIEDQEDASSPATTLRYPKRGPATATGFTPEEIRQRIIKLPARERHLLIVGRHLPILQLERETLQLGEIKPATPQVLPEFQHLIPAEGGEPESYGLVAASWDRALGEEEQRLFRAGWKKMLAGKSPADAEEIRGMEAVIVRVGLAESPMPGLRKFEWAGGTGTWVLNFGDHVASIRFVRKLSSEAPAPGASGATSPELWVETEATPAVFVPEELAVEVETSLTLPIAELRVKVAQELGNVGREMVIARQIGGETSRPDRADPIQNERDTLVARRVGGETSRLYRTDPIQLVSDRAGRQAHSRELVIPSRLGDTLRAQVDCGPMPFAIPVMGAAHVYSSPGLVKGLWHEALTRAARASNIAVRDWSTLPGQTVEEVSRTIVTNLQWSRKVPITLGAHAAMLMLRDVFVEMLEEEDAKLASQFLLREAVLGFGEIMAYHHGTDAKFPLGKLAAGKLKGADVTLADVCDKRRIAAAFNDDFEAATNWRIGALQTVIANYRVAIRRTVEVIEAATDRQELLRLTGACFEPVVERLLPRLMALEPRSNRWVPDRVARAAARELDKTAKAVRALEEYSTMDNQVLVTSATAIGTAPLIFTRCTLAVAFSFAVNGDVWAINTATQIHETGRSQDELAFALGATPALGMKRFSEALEAEKTWAGTFGTVFAEGAGVALQGWGLARQFGHEMAVFRGRKLFEQFEDGVLNYRKLRPAQQQEIVAFITDADALAAAGRRVSKVQSLALRQFRSFARLAAKDPAVLRQASDKLDLLQDGAKSVSKQLRDLQSFAGSEAKALAAARKEAIDDLLFRQKLLREMITDGSKDPLRLALMRADEAAWLADPKKVPSAELVDELRRQFGQWEGIKDALGKGQISKSDMHQFLAFRKKNVDGMLAEVMKEVDPGGIQLKRQAFGSANLTSDYDISIVGEGAELVVRKFNERFRAAYGGLESGIVFDTNVYTDPVYNLIKEGHLSGGKIGLTDLELDRYRQIMCSIMARRKYTHTTEEWAARRRQLLESSADPDLRRMIAAACDDAERAHDTFSGMLAQRRAALPPGMDEANRALRANNDLYADVLEAIHEFRIERKRLDAMLATVRSRSISGKPREWLERTFPEYAKKIQRLQAELDEPGKAKAALKQLLAWQQEIDVQLRRRQSSALYFASEAYQDEGTISHVVYQLQGPKKRVVDVAKLLGAPAQTPTTAAQYINSFFENEANMVKELSHVRHGATITKPIKASAKAAKYFIRQLDAAHQAGINLRDSVGEAIVKWTVGIDKVRGDLDDVEKLLRSEGISGAEFVQQVEQASDVLSSRLIGHDSMKALAKRLRIHLTELESARGGGEFLEGAVR